MRRLKGTACVLLWLTMEEAAPRCHFKNYGQKDNDTARPHKEHCSFMEGCVKCRILSEGERRRDIRGAGLLVIQLFDQYRNGPMGSPSFSLSHH